MIDRALAAAPDSRDAQYEKGRLLFERRAYAEAIIHGKKALERLLRFDPDSARCKYLLRQVRIAEKQAGR